MSRTKPLCAACGRSLRYRDYRGASMIIDHRHTTGRPNVGWCEEHLPEAHAFVVLQGSERDAMLDTIAARGPGRVVRRKVA